MIFGYIIAFVMLGILVLVWIAMFTVNSDPVSDYKLYGEDGPDEWQRKQMDLTPEEFEKWKKEYGFDDTEN
ncbi:MAG: hypothetical protein ACOC33_02795 [bacterium]